MPAKPSRDTPEQPVIARLVADLPSSSFAFIMATGIVSIAGASLDYGRIAVLLLAVNSVGFLLLWILTLLRLVYYPSAIVVDLRDYRWGPGFLTVVAATNVLGDQISLLTSHRHVAAALWLFAFVLWVVLIYCIFIGITTRTAKPPLDAVLDGTWLLVVVAPESSAILGVQIANVFPLPAVVIFASLSLYVSGSLLYIAMITLILYRWLFKPMAISQLAPSYWINMGAAAITALAGVQIAAIAISDPMLAVVRGYIIGQTMLFWSIASWWIPLLVGVMVWRHFIGRVRFVYQFDYWAMVFPLGMYAAATSSFSRVIDADFLAVIPRFFFWAAITTWCLTFFGMMRHIFGITLFLAQRPCLHQRIQ